MFSTHERVPKTCWKSRSALLTIVIEHTDIVSNWEEIADYYDIVSPEASDPMG